MSAVAKTCAVLALAGSAAAFAPTMSLSANRRQVVQAGTAAAVAAPLLRSSPAGAASFDNFPGRAPVITVLDHRGCSRKVLVYIFKHGKKIQKNTFSLLQGSTL